MNADDAVTAYAAVRARTTDLLRSAAPDAAGRTVPACPDWTVKDVAAHLAGACEDILAGNLDGVATDPWTEAQVRRHGGTSLAGILDIWDETGPAVEALIPHFPGNAPAQFVFDATTHEYDLRGALDRPARTDEAALLSGLAFMLDTLAALADRRVVPSLEIVTAGRTLTCGDGPPALSLRADLFELFRALGGRRSVDQIAAMDWEGDPAPLLALFHGGPLEPPAEPLVE